MEMSYYVLNIIRHMDTCNMTSFVLIFNLEEQTLIQWIRSVNRGFMTRFHVNSIPTIVDKFHIFY